jgi:lipoprotein-releasing system permease protein
MLGIALGVAALIIVLSVMNGFQKEVRDRMLSVIAHVEVFDANGNALPDWRATAAAARATRVVGRRALRGRAGAGGPRRRTARRRGARHRPAEEAKVTELARTQLASCWPRCSPANGTSCWAWNWRACWARAWATRSPSSRPAARSRRRAWCRA